MNLQLVNIQKSFHQAQAELKILEHLNLEVKTGEIVAVLGESGSGKSTLLSLLAGFDKPDSGSLLWNQKSALTWKEADWSEFRKKNLGFVFQNYYLIPYLTALENVSLPLKLLNLPEADAKATELLNSLGLGARLEHLPNQMSGGESQRVAIARALIHHPQLLLADEPTGSLDARTGEQVLNLLFNLLKERQQTALIVTHSQEVALRCDRRLTLKQGRLWPT